MMEAQKEKVNLIAVVVRFGLLLAVVAVLADFITRIINLSFLVYGVVAVAMALVVYVVGVVLAHRTFRRANGGLMSYGQGVLITVIVMLIVVLVISIFNYVYVYYVDPDFVERLKAGMKTFMESNRVPDDQIAKATARFDEMRQPLGKALLKGVEGGAAWGLGLGLIISIFTKRKPADFE